MFKPFFIFSHGMGTDTCTLMELFAAVPSIRKSFVTENYRVLVIFSDLGNEYPETMAELAHQKELCAKLGWEFVHLTTDMGFHPCYSKTNIPAKSIVDWWHHAQAIGMVSGDKRCTERWKARAIWDYISDRVEKEMGISVNSPRNRKKALYTYADRYGKFVLLLGFAAGEEKRALSSQNPKKNSAWMRKNVRKIYPLIDLKMDRAACNAYFKNLGRPAPRPSNCMFCFYQSPQELLYLFRYHRKSWNQWVALEARKIKNRGGGGVKGKFTLDHYLAKAEKKFGHLTKEELRHEVQHHGGCVKNAM